MYLLSRDFLVDSASGITTGLRTGFIIPLSSVSHLVTIVPAHGQAIDRHIDSANANEYNGSFLLNNFADKETYQSFLSTFA